MKTRRLSTATLLLLLVLETASASASTPSAKGGLTRARPMLADTGLPRPGTIQSAAETLYVQYPPVAATPWYEKSWFTTLMGAIALAAFSVAFNYFSNKKITERQHLNQIHLARSQQVFQASLAEQDRESRERLMKLESQLDAASSRVRALMEINKLIYERKVNAVLALPPLLQPGLTAVPIPFKNRQYTLEAFRDLESLREWIGDVASLDEYHGVLSERTFEKIKILNAYLVQALEVCEGARNGDERISLQGRLDTEKVRGFVREIVKVAQEDAEQDIEMALRRVTFKNSDE